jgi:hypothetical protein
MPRLAPWHMWGTSVPVLLRTEPSGQQAKVSSQIVRVNYKRPESWNFFLGMRVNESSIKPFFVTADFNVRIGIGRDFTEIKKFVSFRWSNPPGAFGDLLWTTTANAPPIDNSAVAPFPQNIVRQLVAQDIQVSADIVYNPATPGATANVEVIAYFAPVSHVRPEWSTLGHTFGGEDNPT